MRRLNIEKKTIITEAKSKNELARIIKEDNLAITCISCYLIRKLKFYDLGIYDKENNINRKSKNDAKYNFATYDGFTQQEICKTLKIENRPRIRSAIFYQNLAYIYGRYGKIPVILPTIRRKRRTKAELSK